MMIKLKQIEENLLKPSVFRVFHMHSHIM